MNYYVVQVETGGEQKFIALASRSLEENGIEIERDLRILWPRRVLRIRKKGKTRDKTAPIFPGYLFIEAERLDRDMYWILRRTAGFFQFLRSNRQIEPLTGEDRELLEHFLALGEVVDKSKVVFDENKRIRVLEGPLKGLEGRIVKVDKRKKRAKVQLSLYESSFRIDFGFEDIELNEPPQR